MEIKVGQVYIAKEDFRCACGHFYLPTVTILKDEGDSFRVLQEDKDTTPDGTGHGDASKESSIKKDIIEEAIKEQFTLRESSKNEKG